MNQSVDEIWREKELGHFDNVHVTASYDGSYQKRGGKAGGGFSRYCFSSAIEIDSGKIIAYDVACNSCQRCTELLHKFRADKLSSLEYYKRLITT